MDITCPKCAYVRLPTDTNPAWQCPGCGVAYNKVPAKSEGAAAEPELQYTVVDDGTDNGKRRIWLLLGLLLILTGILAYRHFTADQAAEPVTKAAKAPSGKVGGTAAANTKRVVQNDYDADFHTLQVFLDSWEAALEGAYKASRTLPPSGLDTPEYKAAMARLDELQRGWRTLQFRSQCYRNNQALFSDVLLTGRSHINTYATAAVIPEDVASARMVQHFRDNINACLPKNQQLTE